VAQPTNDTDFWDFYAGKAREFLSSYSVPVVVVNTVLDSTPVTCLQIADLYLCHDEGSTPHWKIYSGQVGGQEVHSSLDFFFCLCFVVSQAVSDYFLDHYLREQILDHADSPGNVNVCPLPSCIQPFQELPSNDL
jgi:hypothetical protein